MCDPSTNRKQSHLLVMTTSRLKPMYDPSTGPESSLFDIFSLKPMCDPSTDPKKSTLLVMTTSRYNQYVTRLPTQTVPFFVMTTSR